MDYVERGQGHFEWELIKALASSPRQRAVVQNIDPLKRGKRTAFGYDADYPSLVTSRKFYGYSDGSAPPSLEHFENTTFLREPPYVAARLLALPRVAVHGVADSEERTERQFEYDKKPLTAVGQLGQHLQTHDPHLETICVRWETIPGRPPIRECIEWEQVPASIVTVRGNTTRVTSFADAINLRDPVSTNFEYDSTGNVLRTFDDFGAGMEVVYGPEYRFSLPTRHVIGSMDPSSALRVTTTLQHYLGVGLLKEERDHDSRVTSYKYSKGDSGWRVFSIASPEGVTATWTYDDDLLKISVASQDADGTFSEGSKVELDGRGSSRRFSDDRGGPFKVDTEYDRVGRVYRKSNPYWLEPAIWTTWTFDGLGRVKTLLSPGNTAPTTFLYDVLTAPAVVPALPLAGNNVLRTDAWGRKSWRQNDSTGNLKYVVESIGPLSPEQPSLNALTHNQYDAFGRLRKITFGRQTRTFAYDDLGRLVGQALPERQAMLDATGAFGGQLGTDRFTDVYKYDVRSNVVTSIDARGVRTNYLYENDPLNRLRGITYDVPSAHDTSSPILPAAPVTFAYKNTGSPLRLESIDSRDVKVAFGYDAKWRVSTQTTTYATHPGQPFEFGLNYDSFGRHSSLKYPARYDAVGAPGIRRTIATGYERNVPSRITIDDQPLVGPVVYAPGGRISSLPTSFSSSPVTESFEFARVTGLPSAHKVVDASGALLYGQTYDFRLASTKAIAGPLTSLRNMVKPALSQDFIYDPAGRIGQSVTGNLAAPSYDANALWQSYRYDTYGNRTSVDAFRIAALPCGAPGTPACNVTAAAGSEFDGVAALAYDESTNRISSSDYSYDASGNLTRATYMRNGAPQSKTFIYDAAGRVVNVGDGNGTIQESFAYGHDRRRIRTIEYSNMPRRAPRVAYTTWFGGLPLSEAINNLVVGPVQPIRWAKDTFYVGGRQHTETSNGRRFFINDIRGTGAETTGDGSIALTHRATRPFGTEPDVPIGGDDDERFTTYKRSIVTGLDYAMNRIYSAELGRFVQPDPLGLSAFRAGDSQSLNAYTYARNDPIGRADPSGLLDSVAECMKFGLSEWDCAEVITVIGKPIDKPFDFGTQSPFGPDGGFGPLDFSLSYPTRTSFRDEAEELFKKKSKTDCQKLVSVVELAGKIYGDKDQIVGGLLRGLTEWNTAVDPLRSITGVRQTSDPNMRVGVFKSDPHFVEMHSSGFAAEFSDGGNQIRHFIGYFASGFTLRSTATSWALFSQEGYQFSDPDVLLGLEAAAIGQDYARGLIDSPHELAERIDNSVCN